jgi:hypothetical protein
MHNNTRTKWVFLDTSHCKSNVHELVSRECTTDRKDDAM